jgi:inhibitor of KinA sporulation pathway (predicted exonuclease)
MSDRVSLTRFILLDLEATCWEDKDYQLENSELLEIGLVEVDVVEKTIVKKKGYLIKPEKTNISAYCTKLTGINQELINQDGMNLARALKLIRREFPHSPTIAWGAWGNDKDFITRACEQFNQANPAVQVSLPFTGPYIDFQWLYAFIRGKDKIVSLKTALEEEGLEFVEGIQHRAMPDAYNTARVILSALTRIQFFSK